MICFHVQKLIKLCLRKRREENNLQHVITFNVICLVEQFTCVEKAIKQFLIEFLDPVFHTNLMQCYVNTEAFSPKIACCKVLIFSETRF